VTIKWFFDSPDAGFPECICSSCGQLIKEDEVPIRLFDTENNMEARFHVICYQHWLLGIEDNE